MATSNVVFASFSERLVGGSVVVLAADVKPEHQVHRRRLQQPNADGNGLLVRIRCEVDKVDGCIAARFQIRRLPDRSGRAVARMLAAVLAFAAYDAGANADSPERA